MTETRREEQELARRAARGEADAFNEIYRRFHRRVRGLLLAKLPQPADADDLCQEVFCEVSRCIGSFEGRASLAAWILGIARHRICRHYRKQHPTMTSMDDAEALALQSNEVRPDRRLDLWRALRSCEQVVAQEFTDAQRRVFDLRFKESRSTKAIAVELGRSNQAIKINLHRSRKTLSKRTPAAVEALSA